MAEAIVDLEAGRWSLSRSGERGVVGELTSAEMERVVASVRRVLDAGLHEQYYGLDRCRYTFLFRSGHSRDSARQMILSDDLATPPALRELLQSLSAILDQAGPLYWP